MDLDVEFDATKEQINSNHSPTSSSSLSDKENSVFGSHSQRVRSIVQEFNKIADEYGTMAKRQSFASHRETTSNLGFQRQGFRNASMHVIPTNARPPVAPNFQNHKTSSDSLSSLLLENLQSQRPAKLDKLTMLQAACEQQSDSDGEVDVGDTFALKTQRVRLQNKFADLAKLRNEAAQATGGKRTAIIDKKARQCLNEADRKLEKMRGRINQFGHLLEQHQRFEKLQEELDQWTGDLVQSLQIIEEKLTPAQIDSLQKEMLNEKANFEELMKISVELGQLQKRQCEQVAEKWSQAEETLNTLKLKLERQHADEKFSQAIGQLSEFLNKGVNNSIPKILEPIDENNESQDSQGMQQFQSRLEEIKQKEHKLKEAWQKQNSPAPHKSVPIYDECTRSISTSPSSDRSIPISSFTSSKAHIHTEPIELHAFLSSLQNYNLIRFAAYRTGMKLFAVQKRLCLDLVEISELDREFRLLPAGIAQIPWDSLFTVLRKVYESAHLSYPRSVPDVQAAIQRCVELLRQISNSFETRTVMLVLIILCNGQLDDKYRYLFLVYASGSDNTATVSDLRSLFSDLAKLPALLGEDRTFGVENVESTVRACLRSTSNTNSSATRILQSINQENTPIICVKSLDFFRWIRQDPQTLVWIRVMHRLVRSEFAKHNAKCAACKMLPIVGIRFRCLHCFNVDLCQNCFFTQKVVKGHKTGHEMHEYYMATSTLDNVRDFTQIVHNKMRRTKSSNKIGYTPVDLNLTSTDSACQTTKEPIVKEALAPMEVNVDAVIEQARREGRLPPPEPPKRRETPVLKWPNLDNQKPAALAASASPEDLNRLILELQRENTALWQAFQHRNQNNNSENTVNEPVPPLLQQFDKSTIALAEAMNCLLASINPSPSNV